MAPLVSALVALGCRFKQPTTKPCLRPCECESPRPALSPRLLSPHESAYIRNCCPGTTSLDKRLRVITRSADDTCTLTVQIGYIDTVWPRFLAGILAARLASWYHLAWSSLLLSCQANRLTARGCFMYTQYGR